MEFGVALKFVDLRFGEATAGGDGDFLLLAGTQILGTYVQDTVGVDIEGDLDLGHAAWSWRNIGKLELADGLVVPCQRTFALKDVDFDSGLGIRGGAEDFGLSGRGSGIAFDEFGRDAAQSFDAKREGCNIEQHDVLDLALEHACLNGSSD